MKNVKNVCKYVKNQHVYNGRKDFLVTILKLLYILHFTQLYQESVRKDSNHSIKLAIKYQNLKVIYNTNNKRNLSPKLLVLSILYQIIDCHLKKK